jgi:excisionase family DNA binding protein
MPFRLRVKAMPGTKPNPKASVNGAIPDVLTLGDAAAYLRLPEADVLRLIHEQGLPARQLGSEWRFLLSAIRDWLSTGRPPMSSKEAWNKLVGVWKDDPFFEDFQSEINKARERLNAEVQE